MEKLLFTLTTTFFIIILGGNCRITTSLDDIHIVTDPSHLISNASVRYFGKGHLKYVVDMDHNVLREISDFFGES